MDKNEAIILIAVCKPLAAKLVAQGLEIELTKEDQTALQGFNQVFRGASHWLTNPDVIAATGLNPTQSGFLELKARRERIKEMRRQHASGEQLE